MARIGAVHIAAQLSDRKSDALWVASFCNGHEVNAFFCPKLKRDPIQLRHGDWVLLEVSPFDLSEGCILRKLRKSDNDES
jgi:translation initiation factor IF-1